MHTTRTLRAFPTYSIAPPTHNTAPGSARLVPTDFRVLLNRSLHAHGAAPLCTCSCFYLLALESKVALFNI